MSNSISFINILPTSTQNEDALVKNELAKFISNSQLYHFHATLLPVGGKRPDPWKIAESALQINSQFNPLIAVNPFLQDPVEIAKKIKFLDETYQTKLSINLVTGAYFKEMAELGDRLDQIQRNDRLVEFYMALNTLLTHEGYCDFKGSYFNFSKIKVFDAPLKNIIEFYVSGSSNHFLNIKNTSIHFVKNIRPGENLKKAKLQNEGLAFGICVKANRLEAYTALDQLYPTDRKGQFLHSLSLEKKSTPWSIWLKNNFNKKTIENSIYSMQPVENFWAFMPFLVGSYEEVAVEINSYISLGYRSFLIDFHKDHFADVNRCLNLVRSSVAE